jgi:glycine cleavage system H lipoate-binding protein
MFTDPYTVKTVEYLTGIAFLLLFAVFWRFVNVEHLPERVKAWSGQLAEWFRVPADLLFHRGHAWARLETADLYTVGLDDFAQQLVGPVEVVNLPHVGSHVKAGHPSWTLCAAGKLVDMVAPVDGEVVAINPDLERRAELVNEDPYGRGWLMRVRVPKAPGALKNLMSGETARRWIARVSDELTAAMNPELGVLLQDGGMPVHGIARGMDDAHWDEVARRFLLVPGQEPVSDVNAEQR